MDKDEELSKIVSNINRTIKYYEESYVSAKRCIDGSREICTSFEQYIECRFNYEFSKISKFSELMKKTSGHLFVCKELVEGNSIKRKFKEAIIEVIDPNSLFETDENLINEITEIKNWLNGDIIKFTNLRKKFNIEINYKN